MGRGSMTLIKQQLDEVNDTAALITNLKSQSLRPSEKLMLYTAEQRVSHGFPMVRCTVREVKLSEFVNLGGRLALVDHDFANEMKGWALVRVNGKRCSSQGIVTRCTYFEQFTTEEAYLSAAETYGGLTLTLMVSIPIIAAKQTPPQRRSLVSARDEALRRLDC